MFRIIRLFITLAIYLIKSQKLMKTISKIDDRKKVELMISHEAEKWGKYTLDKAGGEVTVIGAEKLDPDATVCFISNHQSYFDILILLGFIPKPMAFLAKVEILKVPILSKWMKLMRSVFIDRKNLRQSAVAIKQATQNLKDGLSMVVFPEGTRGKEGKLGEFKHGGFKMAISSGVPIVPVTIDGSYLFYESKSKVKGPVKVRLVIGDLVDTKGLTKEEVLELPDRIRGIIAGNLER